MINKSRNVHFFFNNVNFVIYFKEMMLHLRNYIFVIWQIQQFKMFFDDFLSFTIIFFSKHFVRIAKFFWLISKSNDSITIQTRNIVYELDCQRRFILKFWTMKSWKLRRMKNAQQHFRHRQQMIFDLMNFFVYHND